jgi:hypothetical protein
MGRVLGDIGTADLYQSSYLGAKDHTLPAISGYASVWDTGGAPPCATVLEPPLKWACL